MRVEGTEAITISSPRINDTEIIASKSNNTPVSTEKSRLVEPRSPSQISEFEKRELPISEKVVIDAIERVNRALAGYNRKFEISVHEKTNDIMVKVIDSDTNTVIREIPPEKILDMVAKLWELAGLIVDERR